MGNWQEINEAGPKIQAVTAADVKRVAGQYLTKENRTVAVYTRKPAAAKSSEPDTTKGGEPDTSKLTPDQKTVAQKMAAAVKQETDAGKLKQRLQQLEAQAGSVPARDQAFFEFMKKALAQRIAELEKSAK
jgi:hypothetical protein